MSSAKRGSECHVLFIVIKTSLHTILWTNKESYSFVKKGGRAAGVVLGVCFGKIIICIFIVHHIILRLMLGQYKWQPYD